MPETIVRRATEEDIIDCLHLCYQFYKEGGAPYGKFNRAKTEANLLAVMSTETMVVLLLEKDATPVGILIGAATDIPFTDCIQAVEVCWFVEQESRGRDGLKLLISFEEWAKEIGASNIVMADLPKVQELGSLYSRKGYELQEQSYLKRI